MDLFEFSSLPALNGGFHCDSWCFLVSTLMDHDHLTFPGTNCKLNWVFLSCLKSLYPNKIFLSVYFFQNLAAIFQTHVFNFFFLLVLASQITKIWLSGVCQLQIILELSYPHRLRLISRQATLQTTREVQKWICLDGRCLVL